MQRWRVRRRDDGGYEVVDEQGRPMYGSDGRPRRFASEREAQDVVDTETAGNQAIAAGGSPEEVQDAYLSARGEVDARRASAEDPAAQTARLDAGGSRSAGYYDAYADDSTGEVSDFDSTSADIPIWGWLSGASGRRDAARQQAEADRAESRWEDLLGNYAPTPDELAVDYNQEGLIESEDSALSEAQADPASIEAERRALAQLEDIYSSGGMTQADRARLQQSEREMARAMRSQREADQSALRARGMGGSGASVAAMLSAQQGGADRLADREADIQGRAESRAMDALAGAGSLASRMRGESWQEDTTRRGALDEHNRWNTDYYRDRERFNTQQRDRTAESRSQARQQGYENRERATAGMTGQWAQAQSGAQSAAARKDAQDQAGASAIGELLEEILS